MNTTIKQKSNIENIFDNTPKDIQDMIYTKIMYPQPKELLQEIRTRGLIYDILCALKREKDLKPTFDNIAIALESSGRSIIIKKIDEDGNSQEITLTAK
tara:strand:- start:289 stop:585 length:297 start_codon:yes stop_codon:yes gene_type:complete